MTFEQVDVQWSVVCRSPIPDLLRATQARAEAIGWSFEDLRLDDTNSPAEKLGSAKYSTSAGSEKRSLFWSTYTDGELSQISGGLYIKQYVDATGSFQQACRRALHELLQLFGGDKVLCLVLALEDDKGIDLAPGIIGFYRPSLWYQIQPVPLDGLVHETRGTWIAVHPAETDNDEPLSVFAMSERTTKSLLAIQAALTRAFWGSQ